MKLKISTPAQVVYQGDIAKISLPTESGMLTVSAGHVPMVASVKPGIITIRPVEYIQPSQEFFISTSKGMAFVDGKIVRIVSAEATINPQESSEVLDKIRNDLEKKIKQLKNEGSIEEIEKTMIKLEKVNADIKLKKMNN
ncbi:MAG: F0F1 ATP synthase subunit epsilon [Candidatus Absconditabacterales bacterium]|jgi:F-type H+-transporting ATPase subunit epsilon